MIAKNTDLPEKLAIDLAENMVSIKLLIPLDPDFPMLGGKTLKVKAGAELAYRDGRPVIKLKGISLMGVPMPNAWLGGIKNIDLIKEFGRIGFLENLCRRGRLHQCSGWFSENSTQRVTIKRPLSSRTSAFSVKV